MIGIKIEPTRPQHAGPRHRFGAAVLLCLVVLATLIGSGWGKTGQADSEPVTPQVEASPDAAAANDTVPGPASSELPPAATEVTDENPSDSTLDADGASADHPTEIRSQPMGASPPPTAPAAAATTPAEDLKAKLNKHGSITLRDTTLNEALFAIRQQWGIDLVFGSELQSEVNAAFSDAPLYQILDTLLNSQGYGYRSVGQTLVVAKLEEIGTSNPLFETVTVPVRFGNASDIEIVLKDLKLGSVNGRVTAVPTAKSLLIIDLPERVAVIRRRIEELDEATGKVKEATEPRANATPVPGADPSASNLPLVAGPQPPAPPTAPMLSVDERGMLMEPAYFQITKLPAERLQESLQYLLSPSGQMSVVEKENRIMVLDTPEHLARIAKAVQQLDVARPQVRIWAMIYDVDLEDMDRLGINWHSQVKGTTVSPLGTPNQALDVTGMTNANPLATAMNGGIRLTSLNTNFDVTAVVNALSTSEVSRLLANPNVVVVDQEKATISIVTEIPYQQLTQGIQGGSIGTTAFREAGVKLDVTPRIAEDGTIEMLVNPVFSVLSGFTPETNQPIINKREATTTVRVPTGQTFVIGGLRQREVNNNASGIPILKDLPLGIGYLFRARETRMRESELLVFLTPEIIGLEQCLHAREAASFDYSRAMLSSIPIPIGPNGLPAPPPPMAPVPPDGWAPGPNVPSLPPENLTLPPANEPVAEPQPPQPPPANPPLDPLPPADPATTDPPAPTRESAPALISPQRVRPAVPPAVQSAPAGPTDSPAIPLDSPATVTPPTRPIEAPPEYEQGPPPVNVDEFEQIGSPTPLGAAAPGTRPAIRRFPPIVRRNGTPQSPGSPLRPASAELTPRPGEAKKKAAPPASVKRFPSSPAGAATSPKPAR